MKVRRRRARRVRSGKGLVFNINDLIYFKGPPGKGGPLSFHIPQIGDFSQPKCMLNGCFWLLINPRTGDHFFVLSSGNNAGRPMDEPCPNCFVIMTKCPQEKQLLYWLCFWLWQCGYFQPLPHRFRNSVSQTSWVEIHYPGGPSQSWGSKKWIWKSRWFTEQIAYLSTKHFKAIASYQSG